MKKQVIVACLLLSVSIIIIGDEQENKKVETGSHLKKAIMGYGATIGGSAAIGVATGALVRWVDKKLEIKPWTLGCWTTWPIEGAVRAGLLLALEKDLVAYNPDVTRGMMQSVATIASSFGYYQIVK